MAADSSHILIEKLDAFIRKYYKNQLIRGSIYFCALVLMTFLLVIVLEHFGHYHSAVRMGLFYTFLLLSCYFLFRFLVIPTAGLFRIRKTISYEAASDMIGRHFPGVGDKLLNTLQLKRDAGNREDMSLLIAAINQKTSQLKPIPFVAAIDLRKNLRYIRYAILPLLIYAAIYLIAPGMITGAGKRVIQYNRTFKREAPFRFIIENKALQAEQFSDFTLDIALTGSQLPDEVHVVKEGNRFKMQKKDATHFSYTFNSLKEPTTFNLEADAYPSDDYRIDVLLKPRLLNYQVRAHYPSYLRQKDETFNSPGDLQVPAGTVLDWKFVSSQTDEIALGFNGPAVKAEPGGKDIFTYSKKLFLSTSYFIRTINSKSPHGDSMQFLIHVTPDAFPTISVEEKADTVLGRERFFIGDLNDDHGLRKLTFNYRFIRSEDPAKVERGIQVKPLAVDQQALSQRFYYQYSLDEMGVVPSDEFEYYFEVWDNDGVHGSKSTRSRIMLFKAASVKELDKQSEAGNSALKNKMEDAIKEARSLQKELKSLEQKMLEKRELTWEEKKKLNDLVDRQRRLDEEINELKQEQKQLNKEESAYKKQEEDILRKQAQIEKMFDEIMTDEMKKLINQVEQMMQQQNKDQIKQQMEKMELSNKDIEKELDRMLEQFKQLELEKKMEDAVSKLDKLAEKQDKLSEKTDETAKDKKQSKEDKAQQLEELKQEQQKINEDFKDLQEQLKDIEQKNKELETPKDLEDTEKDQQQIEQDMNDSEEQLEKKDAAKSSQSQKKAADKMKDMSSKMKEKMASEEEEELELNIEALREILENTIQLSKDQEQLMEDFKQINGYNPQYVEMAKVQRKIRDNAKIIEDSLLALSKKVPKISSFVNREVSKLNDNLDRSIEGFGTRHLAEIRTRQQSAMMHANNLGLMLSNSLKQMQGQMGESPNSKGKPQKGKRKGNSSGKSSMGSMKKMQEELNRQLREGLNKQEGKSGQGQGQGLKSQDYARMAAQQMAIRQAMQKMMSELGAKEKEQLGGNARLQEMQRLMEETEKDLFNKKLSGEMLKRQEDILTRLLESEKAERKQEQDQKREAEQASPAISRTPPSFEPYIRQKQKEQELLETIPPEMQPYYKEKTKSYFNKVGK